MNKVPTWARNIGESLRTTCTVDETATPALDNDAIVDPGLPGAVF